MTSIRPSLVFAFLCVLALPGSAFTQSSTSAGDCAERVGIGGMVAIGYSGALATIRFSAPLSPRVGLDVDLGRLASNSRRRPGSRGTIAALIRVLRRERTASGASQYFIAGAMYAKEVTITEIRFPDATVIQEPSLFGLTGQFGYGWDRTMDRARVAFELTTGGSEQAGPRIFARLSVVWAPAQR